MIKANILTSIEYIMLKKQIKFFVGDAVCGWHEWCNASQSNYTMAVLFDRIEI